MCLRCVLPLCLLAVLSAAQEGDFNYDESNVVVYTLPDPLLSADGTTVASARDWNNKQRKEILRLFEPTSTVDQPHAPEVSDFISMKSILQPCKPERLALGNRLHASVSNILSK